MAAPVSLLSPVSRGCHCYPVKVSVALSFTRSEILFSSANRHQ
jgi:hypothetical protein